MNLTLWFYCCLLVAGFWGGGGCFLTSIYLKLIYNFFLRRRNQATQKRRMGNISSPLRGKRKKCKRAISSQDSCPGSSRCVKVCPAFSLHPAIPSEEDCLGIACRGSTASWGWVIYGVTLLLSDGFIKLMQPDNLNHLLFYFEKHYACWLESEQHLPAPWLPTTPKYSGQTP